MNTEAPPTDVQKFHRRFTRQSIAGRTSDFDQLLKNLKQKEEEKRKLEEREKRTSDPSAWDEAKDAYYVRFADKK